MICTICLHLKLKFRQNVTHRKVKIKIYTIHKREIECFNIYIYLKEADKQWCINYTDNCGAHVHTASGFVSSVRTVVYQQTYNNMVFIFSITCGMMFVSAAALKLHIRNNPW